MQPKKGGKNSVAQDDPQLSRLFNYTVFHIGVYIPTGALYLSIVSSEKLQKQLDVAPCWGMSLAVVLLLVAAGVSGAIICTNSIEKRTFREVFFRPIGIWFLPKKLYVDGKIWARIEHLSFWAAIFLICVTFAFTSVPESTSQGSDNPQAPSLERSAPIHDNSRKEDSNGTIQRP